MHTAVQINKIIYKTRDLLIQRGDRIARCAAATSTETVKIHIYLTLNGEHKWI